MTELVRPGARPLEAVGDSKVDDNVEQLIFRAVSRFNAECEELSFLPKLRYDRSVFPTVGQYDWLAGQVLYCLVRETRPRNVIEFSTSSGYSTTFTALALKRNGAGLVHTVDIDSKAQAAAARWFEHNDIRPFVRLHEGDCRGIVPRLLDGDVDLLFIDTLHSFDMARWYLSEVIPRLRPGALIHIHDVMPPEARVRIHGGPPFAPQQSPPRMSVRYLMKRFVWLLLHLQKPNPFPRRSQREMLPLDRLEVYAPASEGELPTIDGNYFEEAVLIRELVRDLDRSQVVYLHRLLGCFGDLDPARFAATDRVGRTDARGMPLEWNDALWMRAGTLQRLSLRSPVRELSRMLRRRFVTHAGPARSRWGFQKMVTVLWDLL